MKRRWNEDENHDDWVVSSISVYFIEIGPTMPALKEATTSALKQQNAIDGLALRKTDLLVQCLEAHMDDEHGVCAVSRRRFG